MSGKSELPGEGRRTDGSKRPPRPSAGLLSFYDRLRARVLDAVESKGHKLGKPTVEALLLVPDVFVLLVRLSLDKEVPAGARSLIAGALAYFVLPVDLFPEAVFGAPGYLEDLVIASAVLAQAFGGELEPYARKYWNGSQDLRQVLFDVADSAQNLLGRNLQARLRRTLAKRGIDLDRAREAEPATPPRDRSVGAGPDAEPGA
ncbi:MAG: DUF1232 domain-containing protein [Acidobacteria bacterium]|nr:DUF1232 domain-containing protein [Acidobacteriota bacterium]MCB9377476.1 DUF1232 domain-containing protein [Holophagales bacterium]